MPVSRNATFLALFASLSCGLHLACGSDGSSAGAGGDAGNGELTGDGGAGEDGSLDASSSSTDASAHADAQPHDAGDGGTGGDSSLPPDGGGGDGGTGTIGNGGPARLSLAEGHACLVLDSGAVKCWGSNARGQTGQGAAGANVSSAAAVANLPSAVREVAAGGITNDGHTLAVLTTGAVIGWGFNDVGLLGDATTVGPRLTPVTASISAVTSLRTSFAHSCAVDALGALRCWGASFFGELGLGNITTSVPTPTVVTLPAQAAAVALGAYHTCALLVDGRVSCWGKNDYKQVGGALNEEPSPQLVTAVGSDAVRIIAGYYHSCALMKDGALKCWGGNYNGQLGSALPATSSATPLTVSGLPPAPIASVCAGSSHTCVLTTGGAVACWGWNYAGQLGDASNTSRPGPAVVSGLGSGVAELACGGEFTCARLMSGGVKCWGSNYQSVLGDGTGTDRSSPVSVLGL